MNVVESNLVDTNVLAEPLRPRPNERVLAALRMHGDRLTTASVVLHEMWFGCRRLPASRKRDRLQRFLDEVVSRLPVLPYDRAAAVWHAEERARLVAAGTTPTFLDGQIAAVAAVHGAVLVTANSKDFALYRGLQLANWTT